MPGDMNQPRTVPGDVVCLADAPGIRDPNVQAVWQVLPDRPRICQALVGVNGGRCQAEYRPPGQ
jgi:hypothetical protein